MSDAIPDDVKAFLGQHIHSLAQLEVLLLVRSEPEHLWPGDDVAKRLYLRQEMATEMLVDLERRGLLHRAVAGFRYQPGNDEVRALIGHLARLYEERRVAVTAEIYSKPVDFVKAFANAFRLREEQ